MKLLRTRELTTYMTHHKLFLNTPFFIRDTLLLMNEILRLCFTNTGKWYLKYKGKGLGPKWIASAYYKAPLHLLYFSLLFLSLHSNFDLYNILISRVQNWSPTITCTSANLYLAKSQSNRRCVSSLIISKWRRIHDDRLMIIIIEPRI